MRKFLAFLLCFAVLSCACAEDGSIAMDLTGEFVNEPQDMDAPEFSEEDYTQRVVSPLDAEIVIGYIAGTGSTLNPFRCTETDLVNVNQLVFESLVTLDAEQKPSPLLADNWQHEEKEWTFTLRSGIQFHNGAELTAYDVQATYERFLKAGPNANPYTSHIQMLISSLTAVDDKTVAVSARYTGIITLYAMTFPIVQSGTLDDDFPRGTGPFWYTSYAVDEHIRLEANPLWWQKMASVESIAFRRYEETADEIAALQSSEIDMVSTSSPKTAYCRKLRNLTSKDYATLTYELMLPNLSNSNIMSDLNIRKAVMYAIDRATLATNAYLDMAIQCEVPILPSSWLYEPQSAQYYYSPERALQLLYDAGWVDLTGDLILNRVNGVQMQELTINIVTYNDDGNSIREKAAYMIAEYLKVVGVKAKVSVLGYEAMQKALKDRNYDLALIGVNLGEIPSLQPLLGTDGAVNFNRVSNEEMDSLITQTAQAQTETALKATYSEIQQLVVERLPIMGLLFRSGMVLSNRSLGGLTGIRQLNAFRGIQYLSGSD